MVTVHHAIMGKEFIDRMDRMKTGWDMPTPEVKTQSD
jgi:hypothetical protein